MKVRELILILGQQNPDADAYVYRNDDWQHVASAVTRVIEPREVVRFISPKAIRDRQIKEHDPRSGPVDFELTRREQSTLRTLQHHVANGDVWLAADGDSDFYDDVLDFDWIGFHDEEGSLVP